MPTQKHVFAPDYAIPPGATLAETLESIGMPQSDLSLRTGLAEKTISQIINGIAPITPPPETAMGSLIGHLTNSDPKHFQPSNVNFGLFPPINLKMPKKNRGAYRAEQALLALENWRRSEAI